MTQQIIQINFRFDISREDFEKAVDAVAEYYAELPGLVWKIWLVNEGSREAGGIYLFENRNSADNFKNSGLYKKVSTYPGFSVKQFDILGSASMITHAPLAVKTTGY